MANALQLRPPRADEAGILTALCLRAKAVHGYDAAFLEACRDELTLRLATPGHRAMVAEDARVVVGLAEISIAGPDAELEKLFVEPTHMRAGIGRLLFDWARREATSLGAACMWIDSDPGACEFYRAMGAVAAGRSPSGSIPGRWLPRLRLDLDRTA